MGRGIVCPVIAKVCFVFQVWMLIDVLLILHYSDVGQTWTSNQNGRRRGSYDVEVSAVVFLFLIL